MVTSLAGLPPSLTVIHVPDGDMNQHLSEYFVVEDLKRLGCSGRVGLTLTYPNNATIAKYHNLYRTSERNPLYSSVIELVRMCQMALHLFDMLDADYIDGLLCDITEKALISWWSHIGSRVYGTDAPRDGILGPSTVAALIGLLLGARNRLHALSIAVPKDAFDTVAMKKGIGQFQRAHRLHRTKKLDVASLLKLHTLTEKAAMHEGWRLPKAVKTTVAELSGKGEDLFQEASARVGKGTIAEIESEDIEVLERLAFGERCRWLWHARPLKRVSTGVHGEPILDDPLRRSTFNGETEYSARQHSGSVKTVSHREAAVKKVQDVLDDGKAGLDRIRGAVHLTRRPLEQTIERSSPTKRPLPLRSYTSPAGSDRQVIIGRMSEESGQFVASPDMMEEKVNDSRPMEASKDLQEMLVSSGGDVDDGFPDRDEKEDGSVVLDDQPNSPSVVKTENEAPPILKRNVEEDVASTLRRTLSEDAISQMHSTSYRRGSAPRRLSYSVAERGMYPSIEPDLALDLTGNDDVVRAYIEQRLRTRCLGWLNDKMTLLGEREADWTAQQIEAVEQILQRAASEEQAQREAHSEAAQAAEDLQELGEMLVHDAQAVSKEGKHELESLAAKVDYEIGSLRSKVEDMEQGVDDFERAVLALERRMESVDWDLHGRTEWSCIVS